MTFNLYSMPRGQKIQHHRQRHFLAEWRKFANLTQEKAADRLGITQASLSRLETGKQPYSQDFLERAAEAYGTDPASILIRNPLDKDAPWSIENKLKALPPAERDMIEGAIDGVLARLKKTG